MQAPARPWMLIFFFSTSCPFCRAALRFLQDEIHPEYKDILEIVAVGRDHTREDLILFQERKNYPFRFVADPDRNIYNKFSTRYVPRFYLFHEENLAWQDHGFDPEESGMIMQTLKNFLE